MAWMTAVATALSFIAYPSVYIVTAAYRLLQLLVTVLAKVLATVLVTPLLYLGNSILNLILLPLRILAKFEVRGIRKDIGRGDLLMSRAVNPNLPGGGYRDGNGVGFHRVLLQFHRG